MLPIPDTLSLRVLRRAAAAIIVGAAALVLAGSLHSAPARASADAVVVSP